MYVHAWIHMLTCTKQVCDFLLSQNGPTKSRPFEIENRLHVMHFYWAGPDYEYNKVNAAQPVHFDFIGYLIIKSRFACIVAYHGLCMACRKDDEIMIVNN